MLAVELVAAVAAVILAVAEVRLVHALSVAAVAAAPGTRLDLAHKREQSLAAGEAPLLPSVLTVHHALDSGDIVDIVDI